MAEIILKNYDDSYEDFTLPVAMVRGRDIMALPSHYTDTNGIDWDITKSGSGTVSIRIETHDRVVGLTDTDINDMLNELGLTDVGAGRNNLRFVLTSGDNFRLGMGEDSVTYPYIRVQRTDTQPNPQATNVSLTGNFQLTSTVGFSMSSNILGSCPGSILSIVAIENGQQYVYGCATGTFNDYGSTGIYGYITLMYMLPGINTDNFAPIDPEPGDEGYEPVSARTTKHKPGNGGGPPGNKKDPQYEGDPISQPGAPDETTASAVKSGFLNVYKMTQTELNNVCACLYSDTLMNAVKDMFVNPLDFIVSLMVFPCSPDVGNTENIKFGKWLCAATGATGQALGTNMSGAKLSKQFKVYDFGSVTINENWANFLDYSQTTIELYLPFIGSVNLDTAEVMGGTVNVQYTVDFFTGMCVANVLCSKPLTLPSGKAVGNVNSQHAFQGNCAVQIPLSATSYGSMVGNLINACTQGITNPVGGFTGLAVDAVGGGFRPNVTSKGNIVANAGFCSILYPYVRLTRPITAEPDSYQQVIGFPSYINTTLAECDGLCVCDDIDLKGVSNATQSELERIRQMCKDGVYV